MRDFSGQNLRGRNFQGQDLRGANFSGADIRGAKFVDAQLQRADFSGAKAGLRKQWMIGQIITSFILSIFCNFIFAALNIAFSEYFFRPSTIRQISIVPGITFIIFLLGLFLTLAQQGFTTKALSMAVSLFAFVFAVGVVFTSTFVGAFVVGGIVVGIVTFAFVFVVAGVVVVAGVFAGTVAGAVAVAGALAVAAASIGVEAGLVIVVVVVAISALLVGFYGAWRANQGDEKFAILRSFGLAFASLGGTSFSGADLTDANFTNATLQNTNFANSRKQTTNLMRVCWKDTKKLDKAQPGQTILAHLKVLKLLTTGQGINQDFSNLNLRGANLDHAQLNGANLKNTDLSQARLHQADLQNTNLTELQAIGTDFTGAYLTGACFQSWNIDHAILTGIHCDYYFLKENPNEKGNRDRRPHDPERIYEPGDAEKILTETRDIVEILLKQCTSPKDLAQALQKLTAAYPEASLQKVERKDDTDFLFTYDVPSSTDKAQVETTLHNAYDEIRALRGQVDQLHSLRAADWNKVVTALLANHQPPQVNLNQNINQNTGDNPMTTQDNQAIATGSGSFINTGNQTITGSTVNLGTISGNVTNTLNQLATQPQTQAIAAHLKQLQTAIETDPNLPELDKADALEQVGILAEASQNPTKPETESLTRKAMKLLKGTIEAVPKASTFIEACTKLLPLISKAMGLPF